MEEVNIKTFVFVNILNFTDEQLAGAGVFTRNILSEWISADDRNIHVYGSAFINVGKVFGLPQKKSLTLRKLRIRNFFLRVVYEQIILPFRLREYDLYFSPTPAVPLLARLISPRTKLIITIHDMIPFFIPKKYGWLRRHYVRILSKYGARVAHYVITVSESSKRDICSIAELNDDKVSVIYNFMPGRQWHPFPTHKDFFISISTIEPGKNLESTLNGFKRFLTRYGMDQFQFYWIGKVGWGYAESHLSELIREAGMDHHFHLLGYVDETTKKEMLENCAAVVYLSHYEGFGLGVLEGLYCNKPAVVSNNSSLPEVVGNAGIKCDQNDVDKIAESFYSIVTDRLQYQRNIPAQISKFSPDLQLRKFFDLMGVKNS
jgi:glycosyltransferase involved in cell wall biosynthesis